MSQCVREGLLRGSAGEGRRTGANGGGPEDSVGDAARAAAPACAEAYHAGAGPGPHGVGPGPDRAHLPISPQGALAQGGGCRSGAEPSGLRHLYPGTATSSRGSVRAADSESRPAPENSNVAFGISSDQTSRAMIFKRDQRQVGYLVLIRTTRLRVPCDLQSGQMEAVLVATDGKLVSLRSFTASANPQSSGTGAVRVHSQSLNSSGTVESGVTDT